jgi:uncharacterized protein (DUF885 family)
MCRYDLSMRMLLLVLTAALAGGCRSAEPELAVPTSDARVRALADSYLDGFFERNPDEVTSYGVPGRGHDRLPDNSLSALAAWHAREDAWLAEARQIDSSTIQNAALRATFAITREALEGAFVRRVCRSELWGVSQFANSWQAWFGYLVTIQPVGTDEGRRDALSRWGALPHYLETEIGNLREGLKLGYSAPKGNVRLAIDQMNVLIGTPLKESPFDSPAVRDQTASFQKEYDALVVDRIVPAIRKYRDFLVQEYLPAARETIAVSANPDGLSCYDGSIRSHSSLAVPAKAVHAIGLEQIDRLTSEMRMIAERSFSTSDVPTLLQRLRTDREYMFKGREELIAYSQAALARAKSAAPAWFGLLPKADVVIEPYPAFREKSGPNEYVPPAEDGSRPATFFISAYEADKKSKAIPESTAFHETIPGHHLQIAIAMERKAIHPIGRYIGNSGYSEGWALYSERLADEMKLYSSDLDQLGMLSSQALRAARLVVDTGLHTLGWSRQQAIDYMLAHTSESVGDVTSEIDRYIIYPGQATSYMLGMLEIQSARARAEMRLGSRFDIREFHDLVLEDGAVPVTFLSDKIGRWAGD